MTRGPIFFGSVSRRRRWDGYSGTSLLNSTRSLLSSAGLPLTEVRRTRALNFWRLLWPGILAVARSADGTDDGVALAQVVLLDLGQRDVDVVGAGQVARGADNASLSSTSRMPATGSRTSSSLISVSSTSGPACGRGGGHYGPGSGLREELSRLSCWPCGLRGRAVTSVAAVAAASAVVFSLSQVLSRVLSRVPLIAAATVSSRPPRRGCCRGAGRLRCPARAVHAVRCAAHAVRCGFRALLGCGLFGLGLAGVLASGLGGPELRLRRGGGCGCAAAGCGRCFPFRTRRPIPGFRLRGNGSLSRSRGGCLCGGGDDAVASCAAAAATAARGIAWAAFSLARDSSPAVGAAAAAGAAAWATAPLSLALSAARAGALLTGVPARWAEMAVTRSPLRAGPPEMPSWLARAWSWASLRPARPLLLAGAAVKTSSRRCIPQPETAQWFRSRRILPPRRRPG